MGSGGDVGSEVIGMDSLRKSTVWYENKGCSRPLRCFVTAGVRWLPEDNIDPEGVIS